MTSFPNFKKKMGSGRVDQTARRGARTPVSISDVTVGPGLTADWQHGFLPVGQPASDTEWPRGNRLQIIFRALSRNCVGLILSSVPASMAGYCYATYPAILQQSLATLFPYLEMLVSGRVGVRPRAKTRQIS